MVNTSVPDRVAADTKVTTISCLRYRDAHAAIGWLCDVLGFSRHAVYESPDGKVAHAQLGFGNGMIMLASVSAGASEFGDLMRQPDQVGGAETQSVYLVAADADAVHGRVLAAGWKVVRPIQNEDYGGRGFVCMDPEGHVWSIGTYDPWKDG